jgi:LPXTG-motif cell wall-anchored protein
VQFKKASESNWHDLINYTIENEGGEITSQVVDNGENVTALIKNVKAGLLPSTGGSGIFFYLAVGGAIAGISLYLMKKDEHAEAAE